MLKTKLSALFVMAALSSFAHANESALAKLTQNLAAPQSTTSSLKHDHNAWLEIDTAAFEHNIATVNDWLKGKSEMCAVVKADAYGNDLALLMPSINKMKVSCLGIGSNAEAKIAREASVGWALVAHAVWVVPSI